MTREEIEKKAFEFACNQCGYNGMCVYSDDCDYVLLAKESLEWMQEQTIDKACNWLKDEIHFNYDNTIGQINESTNDIIERFKQAMKGE